MGENQLGVKGEQVWVLKVKISVQMGTRGSEVKAPTETGR